MAYNPNHKPNYGSIIDEFLSSRTPNYEGLGLSEAKDSGDEWLDRTHDEADKEFLDELADGASKHTNVPPTSKGATLQNRLIEKENAAPRLGFGRGTTTRNASHHEDDYKSAIGDDISLFNEVTQSLEAAEKDSTVEKKNRSDAEIKNYVKQLLNQGVPPARVASQLNKLAEIELFNHQISTRYLQDNAGLIGMAYLEPNTFMDNVDTNYERKLAANGFNSQSELKQLRERGGVMSQIHAGDRVTIVDRFNKQYSGRAVMLGPAGWVLNMGGRHGTPAIANEDNIVKVRKSPARTAADHDDEMGKNEEKPTPVIFRKWKDSGDIIALFPYDLGSDDPYTCSSYEHMGQHGAATPQLVIQMTTPSKPEEYAPLKAELESLGYKLKPMTRLQYKALEERRNKLKQYFSSNVPEDTQDKEVGKNITSSSNDCVRQAKAWKAAGIKPRAKSVKQITACKDCSYFKKNGDTKSCGLYGLPVVSNSAELTTIINRMTAGVPAKSKRDALVQIANRLPDHNIPVKQASQEAPFVRQASFTKERPKGFVEIAHFGGDQIQKLHEAGYSLKTIVSAAEKKFGALEASKAVREFVTSLRKDKGKIIVAKADADFLKKVGIHNEAIVGASKCASCKAHTGKEIHKATASDLVTRASETFVQATPDYIRSRRKVVAANFDSAAVAKYHLAGNSVEKIYKAASSKYGSAQASKAIRDWANNLKNTNTKIALSQIDCNTLKKMGVKLSSKNAIIGAEKCGSCSYRNGMHCGLTGGTLLSFPNMNKAENEGLKKKTAANAPEDGRALLEEFDLMGKTAQAAIDMTPPKWEDIHISSTMDAGNINITAEWKGWDKDMPVKVIGVDQNRITPDGRGYQIFTNLEEARKVFPDLDPSINGRRFTWAMSGSENGQPEIRFETWAANNIYSR